MMKKSNDECENIECNDWENKSNAYANMDSRKEKEERKSVCPSLIVIVMPSVTLFVCKSYGLELHDAKWNAATDSGHQGSASLHLAHKTYFLAD